MWGKYVYAQRRRRKAKRKAKEKSEESKKQDPVEQATGSEK